MTCIWYCLGGLFGYGRTSGLERICLWTMDKVSMKTIQCDLWIFMDYIWQHHVRWVASMDSTWFILQEALMTVRIDQSMSTTASPGPHHIFWGTPNTSPLWRSLNMLVFVCTRSWLPSGEAGFLCFHFWTDLIAGSPLQGMILQIPSQIKQPPSKPWFSRDFPHSDSRQESRYLIYSDPGPLCPFSVPYGLYHL